MFSANWYYSALEGTDKEAIYTTVLYRPWQQVTSHCDTNTLWSSELPIHSFCLIPFKVIVIVMKKILPCLGGK